MRRNLPEFIPITDRMQKIFHAWHAEGMTDHSKILDPLLDVMKDANKGPNEFEGFVNAIFGLYTAAKLQHYAKRPIKLQHEDTERYEEEKKRRSQELIEKERSKTPHGRRRNRLEQNFAKLKSSANAKSKDNPLAKLSIDDLLKIAYTSKTEKKENT